MKKYIKKVMWFLLSPLILKDYFIYRIRDNKQRFSARLVDFYPQIRDKTLGTNFDRHYVYHTSWAARKICDIKPNRHVDISSSLYFCGIVSAFVPIDFYDYRPADLHLPNLSSNQGNLYKLPFSDNSLESISCMHTIEHIGLGRYGDPIDPDGDMKAINEIKRVTRQGGNIIFVTPVGKPKIEFNAHRIYSYQQVLALFEGCELKEFSLIPEYAAAGGIMLNAVPESVQKENYACGCFWLIKK